MERRDFFFKNSMLAAFGCLSLSGFAAFSHSDEKENTEQLKPVLIPALPPLDNKGGMDIKLRVRSSMTNGLYSSVETAVAPKTMGPQPHYHKELDELMYVVDGTASVLIGDDIVQVEAGGWHLRPRMIKHTFWNASEKPLLFIDMYFNQPFEECLERVFHELTAENGFPDRSVAKKNEMSRLHEKFGLFSPPDAFTQKQEIIKKYGLQ